MFSSRCIRVEKSLIFKNTPMKKNLLTMLLCSFAFTIQAQQSITASGGGATGSGGTSSYSVGQLSYTTIEDSGKVSQGVQQGFELQTLSNSELKTVNLSALTYPNPTSDYVVLAISDFNLIDLNYVLVDVQGKSVIIGSIIQANTQINMRSLVSGTYVLKVSQNNQELKTFKIIKK